MKRIPTMREFELIMQRILSVDKIGHPFVIDTEFDHENANKKQVF